MSAVCHAVLIAKFHVMQRGWCCSKGSRRPIHSAKRLRFSFSFPNKMTAFQASSVYCRCEMCGLCVLWVNKSYVQTTAYTFLLPWLQPTRPLESPKHEDTEWCSSVSVKISFHQYLSMLAADCFCTYRADGRLFLFWLVECKMSLPVDVCTLALVFVF